MCVQDKMKGKAIECEPVPNVATPRLRQLIRALLALRTASGAPGASDDASESAQVCTSAFICTG